MVTAENNNKYYNMTPSGTTFSVEFGRVGYGAQHATYPISKWESQYKSKIKKGYKDITDLVKENVSKSEYKPIEDKKVSSLLDSLLKYAKTSVRQNYTISSDAVTAAQIQEAQWYVDALTNLVANQAVNNIGGFNKTLLSLYTVIPRRMAHVQDHLLPEKGSHHYKNILERARAIIENEQKTLDVMAGQVQLQQVGVAPENAPEQTILDVLGIEVVAGTIEDEALARRMMGTDAREFKAVFKVVHPKSRNLYQDNLSRAINQKQDLFWHGSRNENWVSILQTGLKIRPSNAVITGAMFGHGIYFADKYRKSAGYSSLRGAHWTGGSSNKAYLALMDVHVGKQLEISKWSSECYKYTTSYLQQKGQYDSVFAKGGYDLRNNEYIVYSDAQSTIKYLVEVGN